MFTGNHHKTNSLTCWKINSKRKASTIVVQITYENPDIVNVLPRKRNVHTQTCPSRTNDAINAGSIGLQNLGKVVGYRPKVRYFVKYHSMWSKPVKLEPGKERRWIVTRLVKRNSISHSSDSRSGKLGLSNGYQRLKGLKSVVTLRITKRILVLRLLLPFPQEKKRSK